MAKKVLIFSVTYFPFIGGAEVALKEITDRIDNIQFDLITAKLSKKLPDFARIGNINVFRVGNGNKLDKYLYPIRGFLLAKKLHKQHNYNLVWAMMANWAGITALLFKKKFKNIPYLLTLQSGDSNFFIKIRTWFWHHFYKQVYTKADHLQVISNWLKDRAKKYGYKKEISLVPNGVDIKKFSNLEKNHSNQKIILTDSRLVAKNGVGDLIKAIHLLITSYGLRVTLLILGDGPLRTDLENLTKKLNLDNKVKFLGAVPYDKIQNYYTQADVFCRPSLSEGFGNVFIQAMAAGIPVIASPVGGILDFLQDGQTGWFCQLNNPKSIAQKINYILDKKNKTEIDNVIQNAKQMVAAKYTWDIVSTQMNSIFNSLIR